MRKFLMLPLVCLLTLTMQAEDKKDTTKTDGYKFMVVKENPITSVKNQASSGTCWSFSSIGFLESELIKAGKGVHDLSEMYIVRKNYEDKAKKFVRLSGKLNFGQGGSFADVIGEINEYGLMPESAYEGLNYGETKHKHAELENVLTAYLNAVVENKNKKLSTAWYNGFKGILDAYLGILPEKVTVDGKSITPQEYAKSLGVNSDDYVSITSFTHHPFYSQFAIEVPDNWRWEKSYNLPLDEFMQVIDNAINNGYTVLWGSDVSEDGFSRKGIAVVPDEEDADIVGSDQAHWLGLSADEKKTEIRKKIEAGPVKERIVNQDIRQKAFDDYETTDDHGMLIYGIAEDVNGTKYYMVKNSWGETGKYKGLWYASDTFVRYKTLNYVVNKKAIPKEIQKKLNIQ